MLVRESRDLCGCSAPCGKQSNERRHPALYDAWERRRLVCRPDLSDLQLGRRLQCIELDRFAPALYRRFVHFVIGQVEAGSDGGLA